MRILVVTNMYPSEKYPHYGVFVKNCVDILKENNHQVEVVALHKQNSKIKKLSGYLKFYYDILKKCVLGDYDAVYGHYASHIALPIICASFLKKQLKIVINVHGNDIVPETRKDKKYIFIVKKLLKISDWIIAPSSYYAEILKEYYNCDKTKIMIYPSGGVNLDIFHPIKLDCDKEIVKSKGDNIYIGYVSRIEKNKGWDIFLKAGKKIIEKRTNVKLFVVGSGEESGKFDEMVKSLELKEFVIKYDFLPQEKIAIIYNLLDVFVFPTYRKSESLGLVGLEAMACGTVTVLPDKYGPSSYGINEENCFQFETGDINSLYNTIEKALIYKMSIKKDIQNSAIKEAENYSQKNTKKFLLELFDKINSNR